MERFIDDHPEQTLLTEFYLKSSMERFIEKLMLYQHNIIINLKSSMERFIAPDTLFTE